MSFEHVNKKSERVDEESIPDTEDAPPVTVDADEPDGFVCDVGICDETVLS